jgi:hypothetical protein
MNMMHYFSRYKEKADFARATWPHEATRYHDLLALRHCASHSAKTGLPPCFTAVATN